MTERFRVSTHDNGYYCVSISNYEGGNVVSATDYDALLSEVAQLRDALRPFVSRISLFRRHPSDEGDIFECPFCRRHHADWTQIPHDLMLCPVAAAALLLKCGDLEVVAALAGKEQVSGDG